MYIEVMSNLSPSDFATLGICLMHDIEKLFPIMSTRNGFCSGVVSHPAKAAVNVTAATLANLHNFIFLPF